MLIVDLDELQKAKDFIALVNSVPLAEIAWQRNGETMPIDLEALEEWRFTGLNNYYAYETLLMPRDADTE
jgi:hypothetical protein